MKNLKKKILIKYQNFLKHFKLIIASKSIIRFSSTKIFFCNDFIKKWQYFFIAISLKNYLIKKDLKKNFNCWL